MDKGTMFKVVVLGIACILILAWPTLRVAMAIYAEYGPLCSGIFLGAMLAAGVILVLRPRREK